MIILKLLIIGSVLIYTVDFFCFVNKMTFHLVNWPRFKGNKNLAFCLIVCYSVVNREKQLKHVSVREQKEVVFLKCIYNSLTQLVSLIQSVKNCLYIP